MKIVFVLLLLSIVVVAAAPMDRKQITDERTLNWIRECDEQFAEVGPCPDEAVDLAIQTFDLMNQFEAYEKEKNRTFELVATMVDESGRYRATIMKHDQSNETQLTIEDLHEAEETQMSLQKTAEQWNAQNKADIAEHKRIMDTVAEIAALHEQAKTIRRNTEMQKAQHLLIQSKIAELRASSDYSPFLDDMGTLESVQNDDNEN
jgi:hypothetical protein